MNRIPQERRGLASVTAVSRVGGAGPRGDADGNGTLTRAEVQAHAAEKFAKMDANGDGTYETSVNKPWSELR